MSSSDRAKFTMITTFGYVLGVSALSACSGGGGGTSQMVTAAPTSTTTTTATATPAPDPIVSPPQGASLHGNAFPLATGTTPNFTSSLPANGTTFPLDDAVLKTAVGDSQTATTVSGYTNSLTGGATLTLQGATTSNSPPGSTRNVFELKVPGLSLDAPNIVSGTYNTLPDGRQLILNTSALNYSMLGAWGVTAWKAGSTQADTIYWGIGFTGYQTPTAGIPTSGTATYTAGGAIGNVHEGLISGGGGVAGLAIEFTKTPGGPFVDLFGQASVDVNFGTGKVNGSLFNMTAYLSGPSTDEPWNNVSLTGNLSGATMQGTTAVTSTPSGALSFSGGATGTFSGALFGPNAQELGLSWTLYDPNGGGKSAIGVLGATTP